MIIRCKIDVSKVDKARLFKGEKGTYLDITLLENKAGADQYGNHFMCVQGVSKEEREQGIQGAILGNGKIVVANNAPTRQTPSSARQSASQQEPTSGDNSDIPF